MLHRHVRMHNAKACRRAHSVRAGRGHGESEEASFRQSCQSNPANSRYRPVSPLRRAVQTCLQSWSSPSGQTTSWRRWCACGFSLCSSEARRGRTANACCCPTRPCTGWTSPNSPSGSPTGRCSWPRRDASPSQPPRSSGRLTSPTWWHASCWSPRGLSGGRLAMPVIRPSSATRPTHMSSARGSLNRRRWGRWCTSCLPLQTAAALRLWTAPSPSQRIVET